MEARTKEWGTEVAEGRASSTATPAAPQAGVPALPPAGEPFNVSQAKECMGYALENVESALAWARAGNVREAARALEVAATWLRFAQKYLEYQIKEILRLAGESE